MKPKSSPFTGYCMKLFLLQAMASTSETVSVTTSTAHLVASVGGQAEFSCHFSPPQSAEHLEMSWFKSDHSKHVYLYRDGHEVSGEVAPEYVDRTELVKEAIREGKVSLRLHNISTADDGLYQCSFKSGDFSDTASMNLSVIALGLETQIEVQTAYFWQSGVMVECSSRGWFPQPQMEWRDSKGDVVPHTSKSYSQDTARLFHMKMTLFLRNSSQGNMTCYISNPVTGEEKRTNIILTEGLFSGLDTFVMITVVLILYGTLIMIIICSCCSCNVCCKKVESQNTSLTHNKWCRYNIISFLSSLLGQPILFISVFAMLFVYLRFRNRVSISDPLFRLYNEWMQQLAKMIVWLVTYSIALIFFLYLTLKGQRRPR